MRSFSATGFFSAATAVILLCGQGVITAQQAAGPLPQAPGVAVLPGAQLGTQTPPGIALPSPPPDPRASLPVKPGAVNLRDVLARVYSNNPALLSARRNLDATRAQEIQAGVRANPNLALVGQDVTLGAQNPASPYSYSAQVSRLFERGQKRRWRLDVARSTTVQTEDQLHDQERSTALAAKQAFVDMLMAKAALQLATSNLADFQREVDINRARYQAGDIGKLDFERLDLQLAQFESDLSAAKTNLGQASDQLQTLMGIESPAPGFDIVGDVQPPALKMDLAALDAKALASRPDYQAAVAGVAVAEAGIKLADANGTTDPTLEGEYDRTSTFNSAGFNVSIPLRIFDRNQGNKATARFTAESNRFAVTAARDQVLSDVDQAWLGYTQAQALSDRYSGHYLGEASDVLRIAQFAYEHGGIALIDYLDALRNARQTTSDALSAYGATWMAIHQLSFASASELAP